MRRGLSPSPSTEEGQDGGNSPSVATKPATQKRGNTIVVPAKAGTQRGGAGRGSSPSPLTSESNTPVVATKPANQKSAAVRGSHSPTRNSKPETRNFPPITIEELERFDFTREHAALYNFARDEITGGIYGYDELGPFVADEEGEIHHIDPSRVAGYERVVRSSPVAPERSAARSGRGRRGSRPSQAKDRNPKIRTSPHPRTLNRRRKNPNTQPRHSKVATGSPPSTPGRSPPKIWV